MAMKSSQSKKKRRPMTDAEKELRCQKIIAYWTSPEGIAEKKRRAERMAAYNRDPEMTKKRLSPESRKRAGLRLAHVNRTRERPEAERAAAAVRMSERVRSGECRRGPLTEAEKEAIRERMAGNQYGAGKTMSDENRVKASERMKADNPVHKPGVRARILESIRREHGDDFFSEHFRRLWSEGKAKPRTEYSLEERAALSLRMTADNPMKDPEVAARTWTSRTPEQKQSMSDRMKQTWAEGKIIPNMFLGKGNVKPANKTELMLFPMAAELNGRFVGDGNMWVPITTSGIRRNPDFIFGSGKDKTALLVHGTYWHRDASKAEVEMLDYLNAGWHLFILWTKGIKDWMLPSIRREVELWLAECKQSETPALRQFMTWNATRITTS